MTYDVQTCGPETNLSAAAMQMWKGDCGVLPVVAGGKIVGMITDRDICMAAATKHRDPAKIRKGGDFGLENTLKAICAHRAVSRPQPRSRQQPQPQQQLAAV